MLQIIRQKISGDYKEKGAKNKGDRAYFLL